MLNQMHKESSSNTDEETSTDEEIIQNDEQVEGGNRSTEAYSFCMSLLLIML